MRREIMQFATVAASALALEGCAGHNQAPAPPARSTTASTPALTDINLGSLPAHLPEAVRDDAKDAVAIEAKDTLSSSTKRGITRSVVSSYAGSGFRVGDSLYLSAGHIVDDGNNRPFRYDSVCGDLSVDTPTLNPASIGQDGNGSAREYFGDSLYADKVVGTFNNNDISTPDESIFYAPNSNHDVLPSFSPIKFVSGTVKLGENIFSISYEPTARGEARDPNQANLSAKDIKQRLDKPAILGGVVIGFYDDKYVVADGLHSYGASFDDNGRPGESGGVELTNNGEMAGETTRGIIKPITVKRLAQMFNVNLTGTSPDKMVTYSLAQPISSQTVKTMEQRLKKSKTCTYPSSP